MIKYFCDRCEKEVGDSYQNLYRISIWHDEKVGNKRMIDNARIERCVCDDCLNDFKCLLDSYKQL